MRTLIRGVQLMIKSSLTATLAISALSGADPVSKFDAIHVGEGVAEVKALLGEPSRSFPGFSEGKVYMTFTATAIKGNTAVPMYIEVTFVNGLVDAVSKPKPGTGYNAEATARQSEEPKPAWFAQHPWKAATVIDVKQGTEQQQGILSGENMTYDVWTFILRSEEGTFEIQDEIYRGFSYDRHGPLTKDVGFNTAYYRDGGRLVVMTGVRGKGKNQRPTTRSYRLIKFTPASN